VTTRASIMCRLRQVTTPAAPTRDAVTVGHLALGHASVIVAAATFDTQSQGLEGLPSVRLPSAG